MPEMARFSGTKACAEDAPAIKCADSKSQILTLLKTRLGSVTARYVAIKTSFLAD